MNEPLRLGFLGAGHVGGSTLRYLHDHADRLTALAGRPLEIVRVVVRDADKAAARVGDWVRTRLAHDVDDVIGAFDIDVVVATMGGRDPEEGCIRRALDAGQHVVTANKAVIARSGPELEALARARGRALLYEAAVGGGTPILRNLASSLAPVVVTGVEGVLNGTCNYLLSRLRTGDPFDAALADAQRLGLAEADPSMDVDGIDAAQKLAIVVGLGGGAWLRPEDATTRGIREVRPADFDAAAHWGATIVLVARARHADDGTWEAGVEPHAVELAHPLAHLDRAQNAVRIATQWGGPFVFAATGAGGEPTSVAVLGDLLALAQGRWEAEKRTSLADAHPVLTRPFGTLTPRRFLLRYDDAAAAGPTPPWAEEWAAPAGFVYRRTRDALRRPQLDALLGPDGSRRPAVFPVLTAA